MSSSIIACIVILILFIAVVAFLYKKGKLRIINSTIEQIFPMNTEKKIEQYASATKKEQEQSTDLNRVLEAKRKYIQSKETNRKLKKEIANVKDKDNPDDILSMLRGKKK